MTLKMCRNCPEEEKKTHTQCYLIVANFDTVSTKHFGMWSGVNILEIIVRVYIYMYYLKTESECFIIVYRREPKASGYIQ